MNFGAVTIRRAHFEPPYTDMSTDIDRCRAYRPTVTAHTTHKSYEFLQRILLRITIEYEPVRARRTIIIYEKKRDNLMNLKVICIWQSGALTEYT